MEIVVGICTLCIYIICWKPIMCLSLIMSDCSKISILGQSIKHVTLVDYAGPLPLPNSEGTRIAVRSNGLQPQVFIISIISLISIAGMENVSCGTI